VESPVCPAHLSALARTPPKYPTTPSGIAYELALAGATVYATARSTATADCTESELGGTLADLAEEVSCYNTGACVRACMSA
jgi:hypothetical protein